MSKPWLLIGLAMLALPATANAQAPKNQDCTLIVPANPRSAIGLATPYVFKATNPANGLCSEVDADQSAFVQAGVIDLDTGQMSFYNPLVITQGTTPIANPIVPDLPDNRVVALWFGFNANNLTLVSAVGPEDLVDNNCRQGMAQFAYCNAPAFFAAAHQAIADGNIVVPPLGSSPPPPAGDGQVCPSVRSFTIADQDQSDNLTTTYLKNTAGQTAQFNAANATIPGTIRFGNPSDNRLMNFFWNPAIGCKNWEAPDLTNPGTTTPALALNELQARAHQAAPRALIPAGDPFVLDPPITGVTGTPNNLRLVNRYRRGVGQPTVADLAQADTKAYCLHEREIAPDKIQLDKALLKAFPKNPFPNVADSLFTFVGQRFVGTYELLHCQALTGLPNEVTLHFNTHNVVDNVCFNGQPCPAP